MSTYADEQDLLCARWSTNCTACTLVSQTPSGGQFTSLRCQWVKGGGCVSRPQEFSTGIEELSAWVKKHEDYQAGPNGKFERHEHSRPACLTVVRDPWKCLEDQSSSFEECTVASPSCGVCIAKGPTCGFCAKRTLAHVDSSLAPVRCVVGSDAYDATTSSAPKNPCSIRCDGYERDFEFSGSNLQGVIEYPIWRRHGLRYALNQRCLWEVGRLPRQLGGHVSAVFDHSLSKYDALHISEATRDEGTLPKIIGVHSEVPVFFSKLSAPVIIEFISSGIHEASGFTMIWNFTPPAFDGTGSGTSTGAQTTEEEPSFSFGETHIILWIVVVLVSLMCCLAGGFTCLKYWTREPGVGQAGDVTSKAYSSADFVSSSEGDLGQSRQRTSGTTASTLGKDRATTASDAPQKPRPKWKARSAPSNFSHTTSTPPPPPPPPPPPTPPKPTSRQSPAPPMAEIPKRPSKCQKPRKHSYVKVSSSTVAPPESSDLPPEAADLAQNVYRELAQNAYAPEGHRKAILRELQRRWHPDKNPETDKVVATAIFQYINANSQSFLSGDEFELG